MKQTQRNVSYLHIARKLSAKHAFCNWEHDGMLHIDRQYRALSHRVVPPPPHYHPTISTTSTTPYIHYLHHPIHPPPHYLHYPLLPTPLPPHYLPYPIHPPPHYIHYPLLPPLPPPHFLLANPIQPNVHTYVL